MATKLKHKHIWQTLVVRRTEAYIEAREFKPIETGSLLLFGLGSIACLTAGAIVGLSPSGLLGTVLIVCGAGGAIIGLAILMLYRPPRVLRLYPAEQLAHRFRRFLFIRLPGQWHDLSGGGLRVEKTPVTTAAENRLSVGAALVTVLLMLLGPLGFIAALFAGSGRDGNVQVPTYALAYSGQKGLPLVVLVKRSECERLMRDYAEAQRVLD